MEEYFVPLRNYWARFTPVEYMKYAAQFIHTFANVEIQNIDVKDNIYKITVVKELIKNELLGTQGQMLWDGVNDNNQKASIGPYVIIIELTDIDGTIKRVRKTVVLAIKL